MADTATFSNPVIVAERVLDIGVINVDAKVVAEALKTQLDHWAPGGCSAVARLTDSGDVLVGRNMDLSISRKPAFTFVLDNGGYKARGLAYSHLSGEDYEVAKNGISGEYAAMVACIATDFMNEKGFYTEINMRAAQVDSEGRSVFGCSGTNPGADIRLPFLCFGFYASTRCANVKEALELVKTVDLYTPMGTATDWNFAFVMADAEGSYGVLEAIHNDIFFVTYEDGFKVCYDVKSGEIIEKEKAANNAIAHANFFTVKKFEKDELLGAGYGRYDTLLDGIEKVNTIDQMKKQIGKILYSQNYLPYGQAQFDVRSEWCDTPIGPEGAIYTTRWLMDENNQVEAEKVIRSGIAEREKWSFEQKIDSKNYWFSDFSIVADCKNRKLHVMFWENENVNLVLGF